MKTKFLWLNILLLTPFLSCYTNEITIVKRKSVAVTLIDYEYEGGTYCFEWKGKIIENYGKVYLGYSIGDRFIAHIHKNDSSNVVIQHWQPFFYDLRQKISDKI